MLERDTGEAKSQRGVQSIEVGGKILSAFVEHGGLLRLKDLSAVTDIATGKLHPYLVSFCKTGILERHEHGGYVLGPFALRMGLVRLRGQDGFKEIIRKVPQLSSELGLMVSVSVWGPHGPTIVHIEFKENLDPVHFNIRLGGVYYLTMTASGYVFRAFLPEIATREILDAEFEDSEIGRRKFFGVDRETYDKTIRLTKELGYGATHDMPTPGITAISAPVFDHTGKLIAAVAAIGANDLFAHGKEGKIVDHLKGFTENLSQDLGYFPTP